ncbi:unnamed protein product [Prunus armeniaca]|uniref:Uncharacterized protein n=1 Tax=Prunus armeniaca TaxID=36596 RepID=A0A6J5V9R7_PRUAR|nr:unnamed protein product [Prunus armeniaca]
MDRPNRADISHEAAEDCSSYIVSGKIVITGAKVREDTYKAFENIYPVLTEFRKVQQWCAPLTLPRATIKNLLLDEILIWVFL